MPEGFCRGAFTVSSYVCTRRSLTLRLFSQTKSVLHTKNAPPIGDALINKFYYQFFFADTQNRTENYTRLYFVAATSAALCGTARTKWYNKPNSRRCFIVGGNKNQPRCGVPCTPLPLCGKRESTAEALR